MESNKIVVRLLIGIFIVVISIALILLGYMFSTVETTPMSIGSVYVGIFLLLFGSTVGIFAIVDRKEKK